MFRLWLRVLFPTVDRSAARRPARGLRPQVLRLEDRLNPAVVSLADATLVEGNTGTSLMSFTVTLDVVDPADTTIDFATSDGTATVANADYVAAAGTVTIPANSLSGTFTVTINGDTTVEADETFTATLTGVSKNATLGKAAATGTILNDDTTTITVGDVTLAENGGSMLFTVVSSNAVQGDFSVDYATADLTAVAGSNYAPAAGTLNFTGTAAGQSKTFTVALLDDGVVSPDKTFQVSLSNAKNLLGIPAAKFDATDTAVGTVANIDVATLTVSNVSQAENAGTMTFTVTSDRAVTGGFAVDVKTADGTAVAPGDYAASAATLAFAGAAGEAKTFTVAVAADSLVEADETFTVSLSNLAPPAGVPASRFVITGTGTGTILNDDAATVSINSPAAVTEGSPAVFVLTLSNPVDVPVTVTLTVANLGPTTAADYQPFVSQVVTVPAGAVTFNVPVPTFDDAVVEPTEQFTLTVTAVGPANRAVSVGGAVTGTATILDNDSTTLTVSNVAQAEGAGVMTFTVTSSNAVQGGFAVDVKTADGTAVAPGDYAASAATLAFAGAAGEAKTFTVAVAADSLVEADETFTVGLSNVNPLGGAAKAAFVLAGVGTGTILNDDAATISVNSPTVVEGGALAFVFTLSNPVDVPLTFQFDATDGTAKAGTNFTAVVAQSVTIPAFAKSATVNVATVDDRRVTGAQGFTVVTSQLTGTGGRPVTLNPAAGLATIADNDTASIGFSKTADAFLEDNRASTVNAVLTITAVGSGPVGLDRAVTVAFTPGGTAVLGAPGTGVGVGNYAASFPAGPQFPAADGTVFTSPVTLTVFENLTDAGVKTATVAIAIASDPTGGQVSVNPAASLFTLTIQNDDNPVRTYDATVPGAYRLVRNGATVELYLGATLVAVEAYGTAPILLNGTAGDDSLRIDYSGGNPVPAGGVTFDGKGGDDRLTASQGSFARIASLATDGNSGNLTFTGTDPLLSGVVSYRGLELETLLDPTSVGEVNFTLPAAASVARLREDTGGAGNGLAEFVSLNGTFLPTRLVVPSALLSVDRGNPADTFEVTSAAATASDVTSSLRVGTPAAPFAAVTVSGAVASSGTVDLSGQVIAVNAALSAANSVRLVAATQATQIAPIATLSLRLGAGGPGNYTLLAGNTAGNLAADTAGNVAYNDADGLNLAGVAVGGSLGLAVNGALTQSSPAVVAGPTTVAAGANPVTLADPANDFASIRIVSGGNVALADANALVLAGVTATGNFTLSTNGGNVTQTAPVVVTAGTTTISTGTGAVTLADPANDFNTLALISGGTDTIRDANALTLLGATVAALDVQAETDLLVTGDVTATASTLAARAGNSVVVSAGVVLRAATTIAVTVDTVGVPDADGGAVDVRGADFVALSSTIDGGAEADVFQLTGTTTPVTVNGNAPGAAPGDRLDFDARGRDVAATPNSFNTAGAPVSYLGIETVRLLNTAAVTLDGTNGDDVLTISLTKSGPLRYQLNADVPVEAVGATRFRFNGLAGSDTLLADFAGGSPVPVGGVVFDGGAGTDVGLGVRGAGNAATYTTTAGGPGLSGRLTVGGSVFDFVNFESASQVDIAGMASVAVGFVTAGDTLTVSNGTDATAGAASPALVVAGPATPRIGLRNNAAVTIDTAGNDANDVVTVASADNGHGNADLTILTGVGNDTVAVTGNVAVAGSLRIQSQFVTVNGVTVTASAGGVRVENAKTLTLTGSAVSAGTSFTQAGGGPVALAGQSAVTALGGDIEFTGPIDGPGGLTANTAGATLFDQAVGSVAALATLATDAPGTTQVRGGVVRTSGVQSYGDPVTYTRSGTQFLGVGGAIAFQSTLDPTADGFDLVVGGANTDVTFAGAVGSKTAVGDLVIPDANTVAVSGPLTARTLRQSRGTGTTTLGGAVTVSGATPVTGYTAGGAINLATNAAVFAGAISAPNAPVVLRLANGATQPSGQLVTTKLYLNGAGVFALGRPGNVLTDGTAELFADLTAGSILVRDSSDLALGFEDPSRPAVAIAGVGGNVTLITGGNFAAVDPRAQANAREDGRPVAPGALRPLLAVGGGTVQVNFAVGRPATAAATVTFVAEATAGEVVLGQPGNGDSPNGLDNVTKDTFVVRPAVGARVTVNGNFPVPASGKGFAPFDTLAPQFVGINGVNLVAQGEGNGTFTFPGTDFRPLAYTSIEAFAGRNAEALSVQTAPRLGVPGTTAYAVRVLQSFNVAGRTVPLNTQLGGAGIIPNPFVVAPTLINPRLAYSAARVTLADVDGDGLPDLIVANGSGDAPAITVVDGRALSEGKSLDLATLQPENILAQFFPFEETFRGGLSVATGDFDGDGRLELVVGGGVGGGPRVQVFQLDRRPTFTADAAGVRTALLALDGDGKLTAVAYQNVRPYRPDRFNFFAYEDSQRGGVTVAVGDFNGDGVPDIVTGAGVGGAPRVRVFDGKLGAAGPCLNDFFAYDSNFRGGVYVDAGRYDAGGVADLVTAPGAGGGPHVKVFLGTGTAAGLAATEAVGFMAYDFPVTGLVGGDGVASAYQTGVGGVAFGAALSTDGSRRSILVTAPRGSEFTVTRFDPTDDISAVPTKLVDYQQTLGGTVRDNTVSLSTTIDAPDPLPFKLLRDGGSASGFASSGGTP